MRRNHDGDKRERVVTTSPQSPKQSVPLKRAAFILAAGWTMVIVLGVGSYLYQEYENTVKTARIQASGSLEKDVVYRRWAAGHGGVYVPVTKETPPNPYLSHVENRDVTTTSGLNLTLVNPAYMTRQVHELGREQYGHQGHITSLTPLRPQNAADAWETEALRAFEGGETEVTELAMIGDTKYLRLMRPLVTEARCLKCHAVQGYAVGDVHGGISVSVPMAPLWSIMYSNMAAVTMGSGVVWLLGLGGIGLGASRVRRRIYERDRTQEALRRQQEDQEIILDSVPAAIFYKDRENRLVRVNKALADIGGMTKADMEGKSLFDLYPDLAEDYWRDDREVMDSGKPKRNIIEPLETPEGTKWLRTDKIPYVDDNGDTIGVIGFSLDITDRKQSEEDLKRRTHDLGERLKELNCLYVISTLAEQPDTTAEQILQGTVDIIPSSWQYPEVTTARIILEDRVYRTANFRESRWRQASEIVVHGEPIGSVEVYYVEEQPASDEGPFLKEERSLINAIAEQVGKTIRRIRVEEEKVQLKQQLHQAQKMEAVAQLAGGVAHDFNNLLTVISGYVSLAKSAMPADHEAIASLSGVQEAAEQAAGVTRSLLTFSHKMEATKEAVELQASVETSLRLLRRVLPTSIEVVSDTAGEPVWVRADGTQLQQILMNLAINARDAMPGGGTLRISVSKSAREPKESPTAGERNGGVARLVVSDTGTGMEPDVREHIFEPFFTTKPRGQGTGLGLAIIHSIVEDHNGQIRVESEPGQGTTFTVELPLLEIDAPHGAPKKAAPPRRGRGEVVLLAEDNRHVRGILTSALESLNYEVIQATDGSVLMDCFGRHRKRIKLLVLDVDLPKRSGLDCLREIRSAGGFVPAIVITGSAGAGLEKRLDEDTTLLRKPFQIADFSTLAGDVLAARRHREDQA